ncbi:MAG: TonB-dependent receptor [Marinobacter sp.]|uniref:TonB-dependent siderophore receptor n=1 Tax=Marinobacter sp. TaxID=50741 RepID=UPI00299D05E7|nr:TonB-dependent receptor [Marinobacter sp.]MDX1635192.1 TonB-dependent receptor [Marinobacter sp.]
MHSVLSTRSRPQTYRAGRLSLIAVGVAVALGTATPMIAMAQAGGTTEQAGAQQFNIQGGALDAVLNRFALAAGIELSVASDLTRGKTSPGLQGQYSVEQGLRTLLRGTGLSYSFVDRNRVTLTRAQENDPVQLDAIVVEGWRPSATEGYRAPLISSATKTGEFLVDVPASVSVVTEELIEDQNARTVAEVLRNVPGVGTGPNAANVSVQEEVTIRGFDASLVRINGVQRRSTGPLGLANVESVEVLKGPFSVLYGDLSPGGFVNIQTKRPQREAAAEVKLGVSQVMAPSLDGSQGRGSIDLTGPVNEDGTVLYRLIASADGGSGVSDTVENEQQFIAPSLSFLGADDRLRVDLDLRYLRNDESFLYGVPARNGEPDSRIDRDDFLGALDNEKITEDLDVELRADYELSDRTRMDAAVTFHRNEIEARALRPGSQQVAADDTISRRYSLTNLRTTDRQVEANLIHELTVGDTDWRFLAGADYLENELEDTGPGSGNFSNFDSINVLNPDNDVTFPSDDDPGINKFARTANETDQWGVYSQAEVWFREQLKLLAGVRYTQLDYLYAEPGYEFKESPDSVDPRLAALYKLTPQTSLYATYSSSFQQSFSFDPDNDDPLEATQYELGVKQEFAQGRTILTASFFDLTQKNLITTDPVTGFGRQIGEAATQGFELEVRGQVSERLRVQAGYTFQDNEITKDNDGNEGNRLPNVAEHEASLWANYRLPTVGGGRWFLGGGVFYEGERYTGARNTVEMEDYITTDLSLRHERQLGGSLVSAQFGVKNVFDEEYYAGGFGEGIAFRGEPRTVYSSLSVNF